MKIRGRFPRGDHRRALALLTLALALPAAAQAQQRSAENALASSDDAFGSTVGNEKTGIYNEGDIRGFNPIRAGNVRVEGVYFDQQAFIASRARAGARIRVGIAALDYPFPAPTGIVDFQLRTATPDFSASIQLARMAYGGRQYEFDLRGPVFTDKLTITGGVSYMEDQGVDGSRFKNYGVAAVPRLKVKGGDITVILAHWAQRGSMSRIVVSAPGPFLPTMPAERVYYGQDWAIGTTENTNFGGIWRQNLTRKLSLRSGVFWSRQLKHKAFTEVFTVNDLLGNGRHSITADPAQLIRSYSGEAQLTWAEDSERLKNRFLLTVRARNKLAESGGADSRDLGPIRLGQRDPETKPNFVFRPVDQINIRQTTGALGYMGRWVGVGQLNLGVQKTSYRQSFRRGTLETETATSPWLFNATAVLNPGGKWLAYAGYVSGLEETGVAPENATNRNETLPAARTTQYEAGVRGRVAGLTLVASAFQITKPYFTLDATSRFTELGEVRHKGIEGSIAGTIAKRLTLLIGGLLMDPEVTGEARRLGRVGARPVAVAATVVRMDAEYFTGFKGLSLTTSMVHTGRRAASARPYVELGGVQVFAPAFTTLDLGARYRFTLDNHPMSIRATMANVFDVRSWGIAAANSYRLNDTRRLSVFVSADF